MGRNDKNSEKKVYLANSTDCTLAKYELKRISIYLKINGHIIVHDKKDADMIILNTCGLIPYKENLTIALVDEYMKELTPEQELVLTGCLVKMQCQKLDERFKGFKFGRTEPELLDEYLSASHPLKSIKNSKLLDEDYEKTSFIRISQGCMNNCSYCAIKGARGSLRSVPAEEIVQDICNLVDQGNYYFVLLADDVGCYGHDLGTDVVYLFKSILEIDRDFNLFVFNMEPSHLLKFKSKLLPLFKDSRVGTLKIPIQTGSQKILKLMNRHYDIAEVLSLVDEIKGNNPNITLISHLIVGFPQETQEDLEKSLDVANHFDELVILTYGPREGLPSTKLLGQIPEEIKLDRMNWLKERLVNHKNACFIYASNET